MGLERRPEPLPLLERRLQLKEWVREACGAGKGQWDYRGGKEGG